jgi:hypothetical protein
MSSKLATIEIAAPLDPFDDAVLTLDRNTTLSGEIATGRALELLQQPPTKNLEPGP